MTPPELIEKHNKSERYHLGYIRHFENKNHQTNGYFKKMGFQNMFCFENRLKNTKVVVQERKL
jgi:hypothetical protein